MTRRGRERKERVEEEVEERGLAGVVWGGVILAVTGGGYSRCGIEEGKGDRNNYERGGRAPKKQ